LNTDGSCPSKWERWVWWSGLEGVMEWLGCFAKRIGVCSAYMVELWGVFEVGKEVEISSGRINVIPWRFLSPREDR